MHYDLSTYWSLTESDLLDAVHSGSAGLTAEQAAVRLRLLGRNTLKVRRTHSGLRLLANQFTNPLVLILVFAALVSAFVREWIDAAVVNQAVLTSETFPVEKSPGVARGDAPLAARGNCVYMGTSVRSGRGTMVVVETGAATAFGQIAERLTLRPPEMEFEHGLRRFGMLLTQVMLALVFVVFAANVFAAKPPIDSFERRSTNSRTSACSSRSSPATTGW